MGKWFWPGITWTAGLTAVALWFGTASLQSDLADKLSAALSGYGWASFDIEGRDVQIKGLAPDPEQKSAAMEAASQVRGVGDLTDLVSVLPLASPYTFKLVKGETELLLSGFIPDNNTRDDIIQAAEGTESGLTIDDEMALARGAWPGFNEAVQFVVDISGFLETGEIEVLDGALVISGKAKSSDDYLRLTEALTKSLPANLKLQSSNITQP